MSSQAKEVNKLFWVTLYCDASYSPKDGGAWSIWLRSEKGRIIDSGKCPESVRCPTSAELYAAKIGVQVAVREWGAQGVQINTDCSAVVGALGSGYRWFGRKDLRVIQDEILRAGARLRTKHVKGHTKGADVRSYINRQVDKLANKSRKSSEGALT